MPAKEFLLDNGLTVKVLKRRGNRNLRLTIGLGGEVRVSIPAWAAYKAGLVFANSRLDWIISQQKPTTLLADGQAIGKAHRLLFKPANVSKVQTRLGKTSVTVRHPQALPATDASVQNAARNASIRALRQEAEQLLPQRLATLASKHGFNYRQVAVKRLKSRWGSCDQHGNITLNLYLMQLPWDLIDYVLLHELTHTQILKHGPDFWQSLEIVLPNAKQYRRRLHAFHPQLDS